MPMRRQYFIPFRSDSASVPVFSPGAGTYTSAQTVAISCSTVGNTIYYTTNGSTPTTSSSVYSSPLSVTANETIQAIAIAPGYGQSAVGAAAYVIQASAPTFSPGAGTYSTSQSVTLSSSTAGASIYYTTNGSTPTTSSTPYVSAISVTASETIQAIAVASGYGQSPVSSASYTIGAAPQTSSYKFNPGDYLSSINVYNTSSGSFQGGEVSLLNAGASTATGIMGAVCWYAWPSLETAQGVYNSAPILSDYNALQAANPGLRFGVYIKAAINSNVNTSLLPSRTPNCVPNYIATCGGSLTVNGTPYTLTAQVGNGGTNGYGYGYSGYNGTPAAGYVTCSPLLSDPAVVACLINFWQWLATVKLPYTDGNMYTLDQHPLVEMVIYGDEQSYSFNTGPYPVNTSTGAANDCTVTNWWTGYLNWATAAAAAFPHTMVGANVTFGITDAHGTSESTNSLNTTNGWLAPTCSLGRPGLSGIKGIALCPSDSYGSYWSNSYNSYTRAYSQNSVQSYLGMNPAIGFNQAASIPTSATGVSLKGVMPILNQIQTPDYGGHDPPSSDPGYFHSTSTQAANTFPWTQAGVVQIAQATNGTTPGPSSAYLNTGTGHRLWQSDDQRFLGSWSSYIHPGIVQAQATYPVNTVVPSSLLSVTKYVGVNLGGLSYFNVEQPFLNLLNQAGGGGQGEGVWWTTGPTFDTQEEVYLNLDSNGYPISLVATNGGIGNGLGTGGLQQFTAILTYMNNQFDAYDGGLPPGATSLYPPGLYSFQFQGQFTAQLGFDATSLATSSANVSVSGSTITSTLASNAIGVVTFNVATATNNGISLKITALPSNTNYFRNAAIVQSSLLASFNAGAQFHPNFLSSLRNIGYSCIRFMDWLSTNNLIIGLTFNNSVALPVGTTVAQLNSAWTRPSGNYLAVVGCHTGGTTDTAQLVTMQLTFNSASVTFTSPLTATISANSGTGAYVPLYNGWANRPPATSMSYSGGNGAPYEICIDLCVTLNVDCWLTIPAWANQFMGYTSFWTSVATLIQTYINAGYTKTFYIEFSNEVWNFSFTQASLIAVIGNTQFPTQGAYNGNQEYMGTQVAGICDAFKAVLGTTVFANQIVVSMGGQFAGGNGSAFLEIAMNTPNWTSAAYTHGVGAYHYAPYWNNGPSSTADIATLLATTNPMNALFSLMYSNKDVYGNTYSSVPSQGLIGSAFSTASSIRSALAGQPWYSLPMLAYESGEAFEYPYISNATWVSLFENATRDMRMGYCYYDPNHNFSSNPGFLPAALTSGFKFLNQFNSTGNYSKYGVWSVLESPMQPTVPVASAPPKAQGFINYTHS